jgi:hypothetical protein
MPIAAQPVPRAVERVWTQDAGSKYQGCLRPWGHHPVPAMAGLRRDQEPVGWEEARCSKGRL